MSLLEFKRPALEDKELIESYLAKETTQSCERCFANFYLWCRHYGMKYAIIEDALVIGDFENRFVFAFPAGEPEQVKKAIERIREYSIENGHPLRLLTVTPDKFALLEEWYPGRFQISYDRDMADYVYEQEKLATLAGKKLHGKRNHINKFKSLYPDWSYEPLNDENVEDCFQMALKWRNQNGCDDDVEKNNEMCVTLNALRLYKELGLKGGVLKNGETVVAFTIGERLSDEMFVVHIEKAFADVDGAYPMINQQFVQHECGAYKYVNREEDTGAEGLRQAKMSYKPVFLVEKGVVTEVSPE